MFSEQAFFILAKHDPNAKVRNRGKVVFPAGSKNVKDDKDHFPINNANQARNALSRVAQYSSAPSWYSGSLQSLQSAVRNAVKRHYPDIEVSKAGFSDLAFILVAQADGDGGEGNGVGGGDTDDHNQYDGPDKPRTQPNKKKKKVS